METKSILNPDAEVILSGDRKVMVKELRWKKALEFFEKLEAQVKGMLDDKGAFKFDTATIFNAIKGNAPLVEWIAIHCTGKNPDDSATAEWLEKLTLGDMARIVTKALEINLAAVADEIKNVKSRFNAMAVAGTAPRNESKPIA